MKIWTVPLLFLAINTGAIGQTFASVQANALRDARRLATDLSAGNGSSAASMIHPNALAALGGPEKVAAVFSTGSQVAKEKGITIAVTVPSAPEKVEKVGPRLFTVVKVNTHLEASSSNSDLTSFWLGVSDNNGGDWTFVIFPNSANAANDVKTLFPDGIGSLVLPPAAS
jgi:hypothetical protein